MASRGTGGEWHDEDPEPDEEDDGTAPCPYCGKPKYEDSERCPSCGNYVSCEDQPDRKPWWLVAGALICLAIAFLWAVLG
jgi:hypothetical protein